MDEFPKIPLPTMPREEVTIAIRRAVEARKLPTEVGDRVLAYVKRAEESEFPNRDRAEQVNLILSTLPASGGPDVDSTDEA